MARSESATHPVAVRVLHWSMFLALVAQFALGWALTREDDLFEPLADCCLGGDEDALVVVHVLLGVSILVLAVVRVIVRRVTTLAPWAPGLSGLERRVVHLVELVLYACMFLIPLTGLGLFLLSGEDFDIGRGREFIGPMEVVDDDVWLAAHVTTQVVFLVAFATHMWMVVRHTLLRREHYLSRML